jgi:hypothetical protein
MNTPRYYSCCLYYKPITIINDDSRGINNLKTSLTDDVRVIIYDCHMFIVQATGVSMANIYVRFPPGACIIKLFTAVID